MPVAGKYRIKRFNIEKTDRLKSLNDRALCGNGSLLTGQHLIAAG
jgi:hypothetical protein